MDRSFSQYVRVGIFVVASLIILVMGYLWISSLKRMKTTHHYYVKLPRATLISRGTKVLVLGVERGKVEDVIIQGKGVLLRIGVRNYRIPEGSYANIVTPNVLGNRMIDIVPGQGAPLAEEDTIPGRDSPSFDEIMYMAQDIASKTEEIMASVDSVLWNLNLVLTHTDSQIEDLRRSLQITLLRLNALLDTTVYVVAHQNRNMDSLMTGMNLLIADSRNALDSLTLDLSYLVMRSDSLIGEMMLEIDSLKYRGTIGKFMSDDSLYMELKATVLQLQELIEDIKKNPAKYINVEIF